MIALYLFVLGVAVFGGEFTRFSVLGIPTTYLILLALAASYFSFIYVNQWKIRVTSSTKSILCFECYAVIIVLCSLLGLNRLVVSKDIFTLFGYIPRQVYYVFVLPAIILFQSKRYTWRLEQFIRRYGEALFWGIYFAHLAYIKTFAVSVQAIMVLAWLALYIEDNKKTNRWILRFLVVMFTPVAVGGEMTNMLIRVVYACCELGFRRYKALLIRLMTMGAVFAIACMFVVPFFKDFFSGIFDANTLWRLTYWNDELSELLKTNLIGVGYGTSYASANLIDITKEFFSVLDPFAPSEAYNALDKLFVTGPHNSFISIAFRLGLIGIVLFLKMIKSVYDELYEYKYDFASSWFLFYSSIVMIGLNVGLESPFYLMLFVFAMGRCVQEDVVDVSNQLSSL